VAPSHKENAVSRQFEIEIHTLPTVLVKSQQDRLGGAAILPKILGCCLEFWPVF
jgi:hypothetical protein